jgi:hypothetical protein
MFEKALRRRNGKGFLSPKLARRNKDSIRISSQTVRAEGALVRGRNVKPTAPRAVD